MEFEVKKKELEALSKDIKEEYNKDPRSRSGSWNWDMYSFKSPNYRSGMKEAILSPKAKEKTPEKSKTPEKYPEKQKITQKQPNADFSKLKKELQNLISAKMTDFES